MTRTKSEITRQKVLDAAYELYVEHGMFDVSMKDICTKSGVSNGSIFHHFKSKDQIIAEVYVMERRTYWNAVFDAVETFDGPPPDALGHAARVSLEYQEAYPKRHRFMISCGAYYPLQELKGPVLALNDAFYARFYKWAAPHLSSGNLALLQPEMYSAIIFAPAQWLGRAWASGQSEKEPTAYGDDLAQIVADIFRP